MATNQKAAGNVLTYHNSGAAILSGAVVPLQHAIGVAVTDIAATTGVGAVAVEGVFELPKVTGAVFAEGEKLIWDASAGQFDDSAAVPASGDLTGAGMAMRAGLNSQTTCLVKLTPGNVTRTP